MESIFEKQGGDMSDNSVVRLGLLRFMYFYTIIGAGGLGFGILFIPRTVQSILGFPSQDATVLGIVGSVYLTFGLISLLGIRSPLKFVPILFLQLCYKVIWSVIIAAPILFSGRLPVHTVMLLIIFTTYIIGDLIAIPFSYIFAKQSDKAGELLESGYK